MEAMRATAPGTDARPRTWRWLVLALVTLVATALAFTFALHPGDDGEPVGVGTEQALDGPAFAPDIIVESTATSSPSVGNATLLLVCSLLILCCVALLLARTRIRRAAMSDAARRVAGSRPVPPFSPAGLRPPVAGLSISRT